MSNSVSKPTVGVGLKPHQPPYSMHSAITLAQVYKVLSTPAVGTGLSLLSFYLASQYQPPSRFCVGPGCQDNWSQRRAIPFKWLEYPSGYVPPVMNILVDENAPFGFSSSPSCPLDSEHLERSFDLLRYQGAFKNLGIPSVVNRGIRMAPNPTYYSASTRGTSFRVRHAAIPSSPDGDIFYDRREHAQHIRRQPSHVVGSSGSGPGSRGNLDYSSEDRKSSSRPTLKYTRSAPPPPPPPPSPGSSVGEDNDDSSSDIRRSKWGMPWRTAFALAVFVALFHNRNRLSRKFSHNSLLSISPSLMLQSKFDIETLDVHLEFDSDLITFASLVDEVFQVNPLSNFSYFTNTQLDIPEFEKVPVAASFYVGLLKFCRSIKTLLVAIAAHYVLRKFAKQCFTFVRNAFRSDSTTTATVTVPVDGESTTEPTEVEIEVPDGFYDKSRWAFPILGIPPPCVAGTTHVETSAPRSRPCLDVSSVLHHCDNDSPSTVETASVEESAPEDDSLEGVAVANENPNESEPLSTHVRVSAPDISQDLASQSQPDSISSVHGETPIDLREIGNVITIREDRSISASRWAIGASCDGSEIPSVAGLSSSDSGPSVSGDDNASNTERSETGSHSEKVPGRRRRYRSRKGGL